MNTELKLKLLQYLNQKKRSSGFAFFELIIVIVLLGFAATAFYFLQPKSSNKGGVSEARIYIGTINKGQQAYYTEKGKFSTNIPELGIGIKTATPNYNYHLKVINNGEKNAVAIGYSTLIPSNFGQKNYVGYVSLIPAGGNYTDFTSVAILCEQKKPDTLSLNIDWKPGIEPPKCNKDQISYP